MGKQAFAGKQPVKTELMCFSLNLDCPQQRQPILTPFEMPIVTPYRFVLKSKRVCVCCRARRITILLPLGVIQQVYVAGVQNLAAAVYVSIMGKQIITVLCCQPPTFIIAVATWLTFSSLMQACQVPSAAAASMVETWKS